MAFRVRVFGVWCIVLLLSAFLLASCGSAGSTGTETSPGDTTGSATSSTSSASERGQWDAERARVAQLLVEHSLLREFLENKIYECSGDLLISRHSLEGKAVVIYDNGTLTVPDVYETELHRLVKENEQTIMDAFDTFNCESIWLYQDNGHGNKELDIAFENLVIDNQHYAQWLSYCRDSAVNSAVDPPDSVFKDWYYSAPAYT